MKITLNLSTLVFLLLIISSCKKDNTDPVVIESFPSAIGTEWHYRTTTYETQYDLDNPDKITDTHEYSKLDTIKITRDTIINDIKLRIYESRFTLEARKIEPDGLKSYAFGFKDFPRDMESYSDPYFEVALPLNENSSWIKCNTGNCSYGIKRKALGSEMILFNDSEINCIKVLSAHINENPDDNAIVHRWYSDLGLMKIRTEHEKLEYTDDYGNAIGYIKVIEEKVLVNYIAREE
ncbi:hypothetical protein [Saccharicrinis aurantiacus]|uniref:hypothetical protein n=1 Tax=Saccharicrinis aurantiacus TaxID=1849719 RepID=UPI002491BA08|nr:hypothetical protein [Saccharicrinis aurantiacus]